MVARIKDGLQGIPRGAIAVIAFGLFLTLVCWYLTNTELVTGEALDYEDEVTIPASPSAKLGSEGEIQITDGSLQSTRANASEYRVYRVTGTLNLSTDDPERPANAECTVSVPQGVIFGRTQYRRAAFPNPSEDLEAQPVPEYVLVEFNAKGTDVVRLEVEDAFDTYTSSGDVVAEWGGFAERKQTWQWTIKGGNRDEPLRLGFIVMWRTVDVPPAAEINCSAETVGGDTAEVKTGASLAN